MPTTTDTTRTRVLSVIAEVAGDTDPNALRDETVLASLGIDSLDRLDLLIALEDEFSIEIEGGADGFNTVSDLVVVCEKTVAAV